MKKVRIGIIGAGTVGQVHIENLITRIPSAKLEVVVDSAPELTESWMFRKGFNVPLTGNPEDLFQNPEIDGVLICSSEDTHAAFIMEAAKNGKHVFCGMPTDHDAGMAIEAICAMIHAGLLMQVGFSRRFDVRHTRLHNFIREGYLGKPTMVRISSKSSYTPNPKNLHEEEDDLIFFNSTIHDFDMLRYITGCEVEELYVKCGHLGEWTFPTKAYDTAVIMLKLDNGAIATIENSWQCKIGHDQRIEVIGKRGIASSENLLYDGFRFQNAEHGEHSRIHKFWYERYHAALLAELEHFVNCLLTGDVPRVTGYDSIQALMLSYAARKSCRENHPVQVEDIKRQYGL